MNSAASDRTEARETPFSPSYASQRNADVRAKRSMWPFSTLNKLTTLSHQYYRVDAGLVDLISLIYHPDTQVQAQHQRKPCSATSCSSAAFSPPPPCMPVHRYEKRPRCGELMWWDVTGADILSVFHHDHSASISSEFIKA